MGPGRLHVCIVVTSDVTAGAFLKGYLDELHERGFLATVICSPGPGAANLGKRPGERLLPISMRREPAPIADLISLARLVRALRFLSPDVVVYATPKASLLAAIAARLCGVRVRVYEFWGLRLETSTRVRRRIYHALERLTMRLSSQVIANSTSLARRAERLGLTGRAAVLGSGSSHGVDLDFFERASGRPSLDDETQEFLAQSAGLTVGFVGRMHPDKGIDVVVRAMQLCADSGSPVRAVFVGGDEGAELGATAALPIRMTGAVDDPRPYLAVMDVLVLMSLREGFPNVVLEAASMGVPAVVADSTGTVDSVVDGVTGYVVPVGDAVSLARRLQQLSDDPERRLALGLNARKRVELEFSKNDVCNLHVDAHVSAWKAAAADRNC